MLYLTGLWVYGQRRSPQFVKTPLNITFRRSERAPLLEPYWMKRFLFHWVVLVDILSPESRATRVLHLI
jgi:hypothetical protein